MRKVLFAAMTTVALSVPFVASAYEVTVRDHPNGNVTVREHAPPPGRVVIREHPVVRDGVVVREHPTIREHFYDRAPAGVVIRDHVGSRGDSVTIKER